MTAELSTGPRVLAAASQGAWPSAAALLHEMSEQEFDRWVIVLDRLRIQAEREGHCRAAERTVGAP